MNHAIIVAAGSGTRLNASQSKAFVPLLGKPLLAYVLDLFQKSTLIDDIILVIKDTDRAQAQECVARYRYTKALRIVDGGPERQDSVYAGLKALTAQPHDLVIIHNASNLFLKEHELLEGIIAAQECGASVLGWKVKDTLKKEVTGYSETTVSRDNLWQVQTPQIIRYSLAMQSFMNAYQDHFYGTDDVQLVERLGHQVKLVECSPENFKITTPHDLKFAETILRLSMNPSQISPLQMHVGFGTDSHRFSDAEKPLILAGIHLANHRGLAANSDGDVILHALFNALSQSIGERSIGYYCDKLYKEGITDSKQYITTVLTMLAEKGYTINNVGIMLECKTPQIDPFVALMKQSLSSLLFIEEHAIGITATSGEGLTDFGRGLGIQCSVVVSVVKL